MRLSHFLASTLLIGAVAAHADTLDYTVTGGGYTFTFSLAQNPAVSHTTSGGFVTDPVTVDSNGTNLSSDIQFGLPGNATGICDFAIQSAPGTPCDYPGSNVYFTGDPSTPTLLAGTFTFNDANTGDPFTIVATDVPNSASVTPEPSSFALLGTGLLGIAGVVRKRLA